MVALVEYGTLTPDGARVVAYMRDQIDQAERGSLAMLNALPGPIKHFYANVVKLHAMTEAEWVRDFATDAGLILRGLVQLDEAKAQEEQATAEKAKLVESLDDVKAALAQALERIAELEKAQKPVEEPAAEPEPEAAPVESKKARKTKADAEVEAETEA